MVIDHSDLWAPDGHAEQQRADEAINLMILESLSELLPTIEQLVHTIRHAERP